jgi:hypothetical protein
VTPPAHTGPMTTHRTTQLTLLPPSHVAAQLRLDERTRRVGLAGVAHARAVLAESRRRRVAQEEAAVEARRPPVSRRSAPDRGSTGHGPGARAA